MSTPEPAPAYTFGPLEYRRWMPYTATDKMRGRLHVCPICGRKAWSCWGRAEAHWKTHAPEPLRVA